MSRQATKRANAVDREITDLINKAAKSVSELSAQTDLAMQIVPWLHDNILHNKGDVDPEDRAELNIVFTDIFTSVNGILTKLQDIYHIYDDDNSIYQANLDNFITKYPFAKVEEVDKRFR